MVSLVFYVRCNLQSQSGNCVFEVWRRICVPLLMMCCVFYACALFVEMEELDNKYNHTFLD